MLRMRRGKPRTLAAMDRGRALLATVFFMLCAVAHAAPYEDELLRLEVPAGFVGPVRQPQGAEGIAVAYSKPHTGDRGTLLLIAIYDLSSRLPKLSKEELG